MQPLILVGTCWQDGDSEESAATSLQHAMGCHHPVLGLLLHVRPALCSLPRGGPARKVYNKSAYQRLAHMPQAHGRYLCHECRVEKKWPAAEYSQVSHKTSRTGRLELHVPPQHHSCSTSGSMWYLQHLRSRARALQHSARYATGTPTPTQS